jgi:hyperosmotically inducible protein
VKFFPHPKYLPPWIEQCTSPGIAYGFGGFQPMQKTTPVTVMIALALFPCSLRAGSVRVRRQQAPYARNAAHYEEWLKREVRHELVMLPWYSVFDNLEYSVRGDRVTLMGQVVRPTLKSDAETAVKKLEGVQGVDNQIEVLPVSPMDDQIRLAEYHAIYSFPMLQRYAVGAVPPIHIIVKNGHVTLEGVVAKEADKNAAYLRASGVPNVFSVTNHLVVEEQK